ncbi:MAG: DUF2784 domain-containing protein [gamma proteobacterium symbiont of Bathyaustriella thionipta]|nr:DUF2784 domain-containing protein [gamma proteobacterium symbiont of Bathyaustriella thionipta]MCU7950620.1 DUF2784 domain-containing protein [gamma proteobacterium symbiont of Bathyaustriella thionipta]MCU7954766.1 DUF2784 domain-containing protein [gamma proteobacterium symbiont of Bathyaustriella thionipta]MCU7957125.1 DUF2784 domain-containing protein [gamma proteobacterium symbiont of Bathyaustriella thionipta]MCU7968960.1 DUF2784 domain-containing protein [gamma proteobacterium symbion
MLYSLGADLLLVVHLLFICFVIFGGFMLLKWRWLIFVHFPSVVWGVLLEFNRWICPLTPLEQMLRKMGEQESYTGGFIQHYLLPVIYPSTLNENIQIVLGVLLILINVVIYLWVILKHHWKIK